MKHRFSTLACLLALATGLQTLSAHAQPASATLQVMLRPALNATAVNNGALNAATQEKLNALLGQPVQLIGTTRTGALQITVPLAAQNNKALLQALRADPDVLWANEQPSATLLKSEPFDTKALPEKMKGPSRSILLRLNDGITVDWSVLLPRLEALAGQPLAVERPIGKLWLLSLPQKQDPAALRALTNRLQQDAAVKYADPSLRAYPQATPNDPYFSEQWSLTNPLSGINATTAWNFTTGNPFVTVAVIDTGILPHPDLDSKRILPGYDFISDPASARDGDGRDANPRDEGDWVGDDPRGPSDPSSWHGTFVTGQIVASGNNGIGIAGIDWQAKLLPVRVLGRDGGSWEDIMDGLRWAAGLPVKGAPLNKNPAKIVNMSLGGYDIDGNGCPSSWQELVNEVVAQGTTIVTAAGNESSPGRLHIPSGCNGVISVGATGYDGDKSFYSNYGNRVDISAPGGDSIDPARHERLIVSTHNAGITVPGAPTYGYMQGTSMASPTVAGIASLLKGYNTALTPSQILNLLQTTARQFPEGAVCRTGDFCGAGLADAGLALIAAVPTAPRNAVKVVEFYHAAYDHYFITAFPAEIAHLDTHPESGWVRTGGWFWAYANAATAPVDAQPVCRFYGTWIGNDQVTSSHFYSGYQAECQYVRTHYQNGPWREESSQAFYIQVPNAIGDCPAYTQPVYRLFNNQAQANHRYTIDINDRYAMVNRGWALEGAGRDVAGFCMPTR